MPGSSSFVNRAMLTRHPKRSRRRCSVYGDGCTMSAKKDGMANIGGFLCTSNDLLAQQEKDLLILIGRISNIRRPRRTRSRSNRCRNPGSVCRRIICAIGSPRQHTSATTSPKPVFPSSSRPGGHAIYIDARAFLPHIPSDQFPGVALAAELYLEGGVRSVEIGTLMFAAAAQMDLVRLAMPRRVYTQSHVDYLVEVIIEVYRNRERIKGLQLTYEAPFLRHFTAHLAPVNS